MIYHPIFAWMFSMFFSLCCHYLPLISNCDLPFSLQQAFVLRVENLGHVTRTKGTLTFLFDKITSPSSASEIIPISKLMNKRFTEKMYICQVFLMMAGIISALQLHHVYIRIQIQFPFLNRYVQFHLLTYKYTCIKPNKNMLVFVWQMGMYLCSATDGGS